MGEDEWVSVAPAKSEYKAPAKYIAPVKPDNPNRPRNLGDIPAEKLSALIARQRMLYGAKRDGGLEIDEEYNCYVEKLMPKDYRKKNLWDPLDLGYYAKDCSYDVYTAIASVMEATSKDTPIDPVAAELSLHERNIVQQSFDYPELDTKNFSPPLPSDDAQKKLI